MRRGEGRVQPTERNPAWLGRSEGGSGGGRGSCGNKAAGKEGVVSCEPAAGAGGAGESTTGGERQGEGGGGGQKAQTEGGRGEDGGAGRKGSRNAEEGRGGR